MCGSDQFEIVCLNSSYIYIYLKKKHVLKYNFRFFSKLKIPKLSPSFTLSLSL